MSIANIVQWFEKAVPSPSPKNQSVQIGCHFEEVLEMVQSMGLADWRLDFYSQSFKKADEKTALLKLSGIDRKALLDSLCDQIVTAVGIAYMLGFDIEGALAEVNRSNWSKFEDGKPIFDENGKVKKGKDYSPPALDGYIFRRNQSCLLLDQKV